MFEDCKYCNPPPPTVYAHLESEGSAGAQIEEYGVQKPKARICKTFKPKAKPCFLTYGSGLKPLRDFGGNPSTLGGTLGIGVSGAGHMEGAATSRRRHLTAALFWRPFFHLSSLLMLASS